jgi:hypothetical protein
MKNCGVISAKTVCSDLGFIVYSHTNGLLSEHQSLDAAKHDCEHQIAHRAERGKESDALVFEWIYDRWVMCGDLYEAAADSSRSHAFFPHR